MNNFIIYFLSVFIAVSIVLVTVSGLAELSRDLRPGIEAVACAYYGGCNE